MAWRVRITVTKFGRFIVSYTFEHLMYRHALVGTHKCENVGFWPYIWRRTSPNVPLNIKSPFCFKCTCDFPPWRQQQRKYMYSTYCVIGYQLRKPMKIKVTQHIAANMKLSNQASRYKSNYKAFAFVETSDWVTFIFFFRLQRNSQFSFDYDHCLHCANVLECFISTTN